MIVIRMVCYECTREVRATCDALPLNTIGPIPNTTDAYHRDDCPNPVLWVQVYEGELQGPVPQMFTDDREDELLQRQVADDRYY